MLSETLGLFEGTAFSDFSDEYTSQGCYQKLARLQPSDRISQLAGRPSLISALLISEEKNVMKIGSECID